MAALLTLKAEVTRLFGYVVGREKVHLACFSNRNRLRYEGVVDFEHLMTFSFPCCVVWIIVSSSLLWNFHRVHRREYNLHLRHRHRHRHRQRPTIVHSIDRSLNTSCVDTFEEVIFDETKSTLESPNNKSS